MFERAEDNLVELSLTKYPGRGIVVGFDDEGAHLVQAYWIMVRSENSRNRIFVHDPTTGRVSTEAADPSKVKDPTLIIYNAMLEGRSCYAVSNGAQTNDIAKTSPISFDFSETMRG